MYTKPILLNSTCNRNTIFIFAGGLPVFSGQPTFLIYVSMQHGADTLTKISSGHPQLVGLRLTPHLKLLCWYACRRVSANVRFYFWQLVYGVIPRALERLWQEVASVKLAASMPLTAAAAGSGFSGITISSFVSGSKTAAAKSPATVS